MIEKKPKITSSFLIGKKELSEEELWKIILYCCQTNNEEKWQVEVSSEFQWVTGNSNGKDTGKFYQFLISTGLDKKIEIVRG